MELSKETKNYINLLTVILLVSLSITMYYFPPADIGMIVFWTILQAIGASFSVHVPVFAGFGISVQVGIATAAMIVGGPGLAVPTVILGFLSRIEKSNDKYAFSLLLYPYYKNIFNCSQIGITEIITTVSYWFLYNFIGYKSFIINFCLVISVIILKTLINSIILAKLFGTINNQSLVHTWIKGFKQVLLPFILIGCLGIALGYGYISYGRPAVVIFFGPIILSKFCYKQYIKVREMYIEISKRRQV